MTGPNPDILAPKPYTKDQTNYRLHIECNTCAHFNGRVYCTQVEGHISPECICDLWALKEASIRITGKEMIKQEYEKSIKGMPA